MSWRLWDSSGQEMGKGWNPELGRSNGVLSGGRLTDKSSRDS